MVAGSSYAGILLLFILSFLVLSSSVTTVCGVITDKEIIELREESKDMFYHAYNAYMYNAFPADELMPLTCQGKWASPSPSRA